MQRIVLIFGVLVAFSSCQNPASSINEQRILISVSEQSDTVFVQARTEEIFDYWSELEYSSTFDGRNAMIEFKSITPGVRPALGPAVATIKIGSLSPRVGQYEVNFSRGSQRAKAVIQVLGVGNYMMFVTDGGNWMSAVSSFSK
jgi:hypothetical protein